MVYEDHQEKYGDIAESSNISALASNGNKRSSLSPASSPTANGHKAVEMAVVVEEESPPQEGDRQEDDESPSLLQQIFSWRAATYLLLHFSFVVLNMPRVTTNMAIVCSGLRRDEVLSLANTSGMAVDSGGEIIPWVEHVNSSSGDFRNESLWEVYGDILTDLNWESGIQGLVLSGPLFLSCVSPILSDQLRQKIGGRQTIVLSLLIAAVVMFASPEIARLSPYLMLAGQLLVGLTLSANICVVGYILPRWTPNRQRLTITALVFAGFNTGTVISSLLNGFLCSIPLDNGWPFMFYVSGILILIYTALWYFLIADSPEAHPYVSEKEKAFLLSTRPQQINNEEKTAARPPYRALLTSVPMLAYCYTNATFVWALSVVFVYLPIYLSSVLAFSSEVVGVVFAGIICVRCLGSFSWTIVGNLLVSAGLSNAVTRKLCLCVGFAVASACCLAVSFFDSEAKWVALAFILMVMFFQAVSTSHLSTLPMDMAPRYAGTLLSICLTVALLIALSAPLLVAALTPTGSFAEWRLVWITLAAVWLSASLAFLFFGSAELQPWADTDTAAAVGGDGGDNNTPTGGAATQQEEHTSGETAAAAATQQKHWEGADEQIPPAETQSDLSLSHHVISDPEEADVSPSSYPQAKASEPVTYHDNKAFVDDSEPPRVNTQQPRNAVSGSPTQIPSQVPSAGIESTSENSKGSPVSSKSPNPHSAQKSSIFSPTSRRDHHLVEELSPPVPGAVQSATRSDSSDMEVTKL